MIPAKGVHAGKRIVKHNDLSCSVRILLQFCQEEGQGQGASVTRAQSISKTRPVCGGPRISEIDRVLIDEDLVVRAWSSTSVTMRWRRNAEASIGRSDGSVVAGHRRTQLFKSFKRLGKTIIGRNGLQR